MKKKKSPAQSKVILRKKNSGISALDNDFYVVGIGASAGGLDALEKFFENMTENSGMAFIIISHLDPNHVSIMPELIQKSTKMKLFQAEDGMVVEPNHVYVTPPNRDLALFRRTIQLIEPVEPHGFRLPIDFFFKSLSSDIGDKAICIILSGMASDGTAGLKAVKSELGMVMVQDPKSAKFDGMPGSAIKTGLADYILPPEDMPDNLIKYTSQKIKRTLRLSPEGKIPDSFQKIFILLRNKTGHDFSNYKQNTIYRRIERRMYLAQLDNILSYFRLLQENRGEIENLFKDLFIGVTNFFRDPESFDKLKIILSELVKRKPDNSKIRIWVPGCSTGEEAYSIAIILLECLAETGKNLNVQIFATDIDTASIDKARSGLYSGIESDVGKERLKAYFTKDKELYHIKKEIRDMLVFAPQSVIKDPPFTKLDLISCRNLLIYFNSELQKKVLPIFHYSLLSGGILFLGSSESIGEFVDLFSIIDKKWKFYKRRESVYSAQPFIEFPVSYPIKKNQVTPLKTLEIKNVSQLAEKVILQSFSPNCVIVSGNGDIVYIHGRTGKYLELTHGEAKMNIFEMAHQGLKQELPALIRKALSGSKKITAEGIKVRPNGRTNLINLTIKPIKEPAGMQGYLLLIFEDIKPQNRVAQSKKLHFDKRSEKIIKELEHELKNSKEDLRTTIEELETSNEELKSTNEEMQSTNEEMQSSNEEMETSKEEMQSLNEELITVNTEMQTKNDELSIINNDMKNLLNSIDIPTIFLDNNLLIKRFTQNTANILNLISSDIGRPINHLTTNLKYEKFIEDAKEVLRTLVYKEIELQTNDGIWYQMRILPYRTTNNIIDGLVVTFTNIHNLKSAYQEIRKLNQEIQLAREYSDNIIETVRDSLLILDKNLKVLSANRSYYSLFNTVKEKTLGKFVYNLEENKWNIPDLRKLLEEIIPASSFFEDYEVEYNFKEGKKLLYLNAREVFQEDKESRLILLAIRSQNRN